MESLSDSIAEVESFILTLTTQSFTPEIDGQIRCLNQKFAVIQERNEKLQDVWKLMNEEIDYLRKQVDKLEAAKIVWEVKFSSRESARKYDELCTALESKNTKIKELEKQVGELETKNEILNERLETLENQIKELNAQNQELNAQNQELNAQNQELKGDLQKVKRTSTWLERKNMSLDRKMKYLEDELDDVKVENRTLKKNELISATERQTLQVDVCDLQKTNSSLQQSHSSLQQSHSSLQQSHSSLQQSHSSLQQSHSSLQQSHSSLQQSHSSLQQKVQKLQRKVEDLERKIDVPDDGLTIGELCREVQSMIFKKILPQDLYDERQSYKIEKMAECFWVLFDEDEHKINVAYQTWAELQKALKWQERDVKKMGFAMKEIQSKRNAIAHPELTLEILTASIQRLKDAGRLIGYSKPENINELVRVWTRLKEMGL